MIGRILDAADDEARDRVITAQRWCVRTPEGDDGERCFMGHLLGGHGVTNEVPLDHALAPICAFYIRRGKWMGSRFDGLVRRFGMDRVVRCIKQRAGRHTRVNVEAVECVTS